MLVFKILHYTERVHRGRAIAPLSTAGYRVQSTEYRHMDDSSSSSAAASATSTSESSESGKNRQHCEQNRSFINEMLERKTGERSSRLGSGLPSRQRCPYVRGPDKRGSTVY